MSWPLDVMLRELHPFLVVTTSYVEGTTYCIFLVATSLMCKQTNVTIATWDYQ